jgi:hypothetical protein
MASPVNDGTPPAEGNATTGDAGISPNPTARVSEGGGTDASNGGTLVNRWWFAISSPHGPRLKFTFTMKLVDRDLYDVVDLLAIASISLHDMLRFFEEIVNDMEDEETVEQMVHLVLWADTLHDMQCLSTNGTDFDTSMVNGDECARRIKRQQVIQMPACVKVIQHVYLVILLLDRRHESWEKQLAEADDSTHFSEAVVEATDLPMAPGFDE